jgi:glycosyltransferase involved in cell wall biosynthesis
VEESYLGVPSTEGDYVAFLGRLDFHQKGLDILLRAMQGLSFPLKIAGEGPAWPRLQRLIEDQANVEWVGKVEGQGKIDFLRHAKFVVVPSRFEGQGMVVVEATALGKSVIVSDIPELAYARRHGFALAFRKGSWPDLRQKMQQLWEQETLRHQLEQPTRDYARNSTWPRLTDQFETYCLNLIQNK